MGQGQAIAVGVGGIFSWVCESSAQVEQELREFLRLSEWHDPTNGVKGSVVPARGAAQIDYAAVKIAGLRPEGGITEADLAEVVCRHLADLSLCICNRENVQKNKTAPAAGRQVVARSRTVSR